jgi:hypothetical protein
MFDSKIDKLSCNYERKRMWAAEKRRTLLLCSMRHGKMTFISIVESSTSIWASNHPGCGITLKECNVLLNIFPGIVGTVGVHTRICSWFNNLTP